MPASTLTPPDAILFDWDNTLVDTWPTIQDAMNHTLAHFGMPVWSMEETRLRVRKSMRDSFPGLFGDRWQRAADVFYERYRAIHVKRLEPLPGAEDLLQFLHDAGIFTGVVSNKVGEYLRVEARHLGWERYFTNLVGAGDAERDKPALQPVLMALEGSNTKPAENVWFIGDADIDLVCGTEAGCLAILVRENAPDDEERNALPPHHYCKNRHQLKVMIEGLTA